jgi:hypothetical protein
MNTILKSSLPIIVCGLLFVACNNSNEASQNTQSAQPAAAGVPHVDTIRTPKVTSAALAANGMNTIRYDNGTVKMEGNSKDGKRTGEWKSFFPDGKLQSDEFFTEGKPDGKVAVYYANGKKMYEGQNDDGTLKGVWTYWNDKGVVTRTVDYSKQPITHH